MDSGGGQSARVAFRVTVTEDKGGVARCGRQAEKDRNTNENIMVRGGLRGEERETTSVLARSNLEKPLRRCRWVGVSNDVQLKGRVSARRFSRR